MKTIVATTLIILLVIIGVLIFKSSNKLDKKISRYINQEVSQGKIVSASVYIKYLDTGEEVGVNENEPHTPASILKTLLLMSYLKLGQNNPGVLKTELLFTEDMEESVKKASLFVYPAIADTMEAGKKYTVDNLLYRLIKNSDNGASLVLELSLGQGEIVNQFTQIIGSPFKISETMSTKTFSNALETLYKQTYLNKEMTSKAVDLLTNTNYNKGIVAGVPENIQVAHKFGIASSLAPELMFGINDCGIVYAEKPYSICVMVVGKKITDVEEVIKHISELTYQNTLK